MPLLLLMMARLHTETNKVAVPAKARQSALEEPEEEVSAECAGTSQSLCKASCSVKYCIKTELYTAATLFCIMPT